MKNVKILCKTMIIATVFCAAPNIINGQTQYHNLFNELPGSFNTYDLNNNGTISVSEATAMLNQIGQNSSFIRQQFEYIDRGSDLVLHVDEFRDLLVFLWRESVKPGINLEDAQGQFSANDPDGNGEITASEMDFMIQNTASGGSGGPSGQDYIQQWDTDGNNSLNFNEFLPLIYPWDPAPDYNVAREEFRFFDMDGNGFATQTEFQGRNLPASQIDGIMQQSDMDGDGKINFVEFCFTVYFQ